MYISVKDTKINLLENKFIKSITKQNIQYNLFQGSESDTPIVNVYVKNKENRVPLISSTNCKAIETFDNAVIYKCIYNGSTVDVSFIIDENEMLKIEVKSDSNLDFTFGFDVGAGDIGFLDDKEAYASQYIDSKIIKDNDCFAIAMRRTLGQSTGFPHIEFLTYDNVANYATEGFDFYPLSYKIDGQINANDLPSRDKHYELAMVGMDFEDVSEFSVLVKLDLNNENAISESIIKDSTLSDFVIHGECISYDANENVLGYVNGDNVKIDEFYSDMQLVEEKDGEILSFFTPTSTHVVTAAKELLVQRIHGNIITTGDSVNLKKDILVSTNYINGVFSAQNAVGNVGQNTLNSNIHSSLDLQKIYGQRLFVNIEGEYKRLNMPSFYEMGFNFSKWVYVLNNTTITITSYTDVSDASLSFEVESTNKVDMILIDSYRDNFELTQNDNNINFKFKDQTFQKGILPNLNYNINYNLGLIDLNNDALAIKDKNIYSVEYKNVDSISVVLSSSKSKEIVFDKVEFDASVKTYEKYIESVTNSMQLELKGNEEVTMFNHLIKWYTHNALIHFATPHGLEQHAGSAWGTRDVCQGPLELFIAFGKFDIAKTVLLEIFKNQNLEEGTWPQWFMFDEYSNIRADDYHGDIIAWPIKILSDYINMSGDKSILDEKVSYWSQESRSFTTEKYTILDHVSKEIEYIENNYIKGTSLSSYGHGDWDDTLQPANKQLRENMVSGWTVPLTYQGFMGFAKALSGYNEELKSSILQKAEAIKTDFRKHMIKDGVVTGFAYIENLDSIKYMLHPSDDETNIKYRLLPINRSIISEIFTEDEIKSHQEIVDTHLKCPDGVRLMDKPAPYNGGTMKYFQRGESASTIGREISLQYVHAHIRYIESMLKIGNGQNALEGLLCVNPFTIKKYVPNAEYRQSNAYFSSSEGDYDNRYTYEENFHLLKTGEVKVKGGWRIYSSGPGIYLNQLIGNFLGIKFENGNMILDPVLPESLLGLKVNFTLDNNIYEIEFKSKADTILFNDNKLVDRTNEKYRLGGFVVNSNLIMKENKIIIGG